MLSSSDVYTVVGGAWFTRAYLLSRNAYRIGSGFGETRLRSPA
jgi:hypothetical protein